MSFGFAIFSWDQKKGAVIDRKYPKMLKISDSLLNKVYMTHAYDEESKKEELIKIDFQDKILLTYCDKSRVVDFGYELIILILHQKENVGLYSLQTKLIEFGKNYFAKPIEERMKYFEDNISKFLKTSEPNKVVLLGRAGTGKTTIKKIVFEGADPRDLIYNPLEPTRGISPSVYSWLDLDLGLFDTSGQELPELLKDSNDQKLAIDGADIIVYVCDFPAWTAKQHDILGELAELDKILRKYSDDIELVVFLHKIDLIPEDERDNRRKIITNKITEILNIEIYFTSVFPELLYTTYNAFYNILSNLSQENQKLKEILDEEIEDLSTTMSFITNKHNNIIAQTMNSDFNTNYINHSHKLISQLNKNFEDMSKSDKIEHLILKGNQLNIIMKNLNLDKFSLKNLICISESVSANNLIKLVGNVRISLLNYLYKI